MADRFVLKRASDSAPISKDGAFTAPLFVPYAHAPHEPARVKPGDVAQFTIEAVSADEHRPDTAIPAVSGVEWSLDGSAYSGDSQPSAVFDLTPEPTTVWGRITALFATGLTVDLAALNSGGWVAYASGTVTAPARSDAGVGTDSGAVGVTVPAAAGSDAGAGTDTGVAQTGDTVTAPSGTDAGVGADQGAGVAVPVVAAPSRGDAGVGADAGAGTAVGPPVALLPRYFAASGSFYAEYPTSLSTSAPNGSSLAIGGADRGSPTAMAKVERVNSSGVVQATAGLGSWFTIYTFSALHDLTQRTYNYSFPGVASMAPTDKLRVTLECGASAYFDTESLNATSLAADDWQFIFWTEYVDSGEGVFDSIWLNSATHPSRIVEA